MLAISILRIGERIEMAAQRAVVFDSHCLLNTSAAKCMVADSFGIRILGKAYRAFIFGYLFHL